MSASAILAELRPGTRVDTFEVVGPVGSGGQGRLYLVRPWRDGTLRRAWSRWRLRRRALARRIDAACIEAEQLGVIKLAHPDSQANLLNEREYLAHPQAGHPHLAALYSRRFPSSAGSVRADIGRVTLNGASGASHSAVYLALAYEPGGALADLLDRLGTQPLAPAQAAMLAAQIADALDHLHCVLGLVHHDLCPENIVLRTEQPPHAVVVDLAAAESLVLPRQSSVYGHERYLPPERLADPPAPPGIGIDIYSLGVILHDLLSEPAAREQRADHRRRLSATNPAVPPEIDRLVALALNPDPAARIAAIPSAAAFAQALRKPFLSKAGASLGGSPSRRPQAAVLVLAAIIAALMLAAAGLREGPPPLTGAPLVTVTPAREAPTLPPTATTAPTIRPAATSTRVPADARPTQTGGTP